MKNLEVHNYGVAQMTTREMRTTNGGLFWLIPLAVELVCYGLAADIIFNFSDYSDKLEAKMKECKN